MGFSSCTLCEEEAFYLGYSSFDNMLAQQEVDCDPISGNLKNSAEGPPLVAEFCQCIGFSFHRGWRLSLIHI